MKLEYGSLLIEKDDYNKIEAKLKEGKSIQVAFEIVLAENGISILDVYQIQTSMDITREQIGIFARISCEVRTGRK
nr:hypothetical protein [uncultured Cellulosilyticum sp.]